MQAVGDQRANVLPLADEVRREGSSEGSAVAGVSKGERPAEAAGGGPSVGQSDGRPPKLVSPERRRRTVEAVRSRWGPRSRCRNDGSAACWDSLVRRNVIAVGGQTTIDRLASELQTGSSLVEVGAFAGSWKTAETSAISGSKRQRLRPSSSDTPQSCLEVIVYRVGANKGIG